MGFHCGTLAVNKLPAVREPEISGRDTDWNGITGSVPGITGSVGADSTTAGE
jgi:hypothetical protein